MAPYQLESPRKHSNDWVLGGLGVNGLEVFPFFFPNFVFSWTLFLHSAFVRFDGSIFETEKIFENGILWRLPHEFVPLQLTIS